MRRIYRDPRGVLALLKQGAFQPPEWQELNLHAHLIASSHQIERLVAIENVGKIKLLPHQVDAVMTAMNRMGTRAILADEVGLGKTIEAGIIIKEYLCRRLVKRVLILSPAPLTTQWRGELLNKFGEKFVLANKDDDPDFHNLLSHERLIMSIDAAKLAHNAAALTGQQWDLVIVDEAHRLKNPKTLAFQLVKSLKSRYLLLLTATPMQNHLGELYTLVSLLKEGLLGTESYYQETFVADKAGRELKNAELLQRLLKEVMVRHRRADVGLRFPDRKVETLSFQGTSEEMALHDAVVDYVAREMRLETRKPLTLIRLSRMAASSPAALSATLETMLESAERGEKKALRELLKLARSVKRPSKDAGLMQLIDHLNDKLIVFTSFRATQQHLAEVLGQAGKRVAIFNGSLSQQEKDLAIQQFRNEADVLICTDAGSEGINLQFCRSVLNFDLPWNPARVEQRIGRVHRLGQEHNEILVFNFALQDTVESHVLDILYRKIDLFSEVIGASDLVLSNLKAAESLDRMILEAIASSHSKAEMANAFALLGEELANAKAAADQIRDFDERTLSLMDLSAFHDL